jgi:hypothetical protein
MTSHSKLYIWLSAHLAFAFVLLTVSFLVFGSLSLDLARVLIANAEYISSNGWDGMVEGGLEQLLGLFLKGGLAMLCYLSFKLCEHVIIHRLAQK